nr:hypothetical protein [Acetobacter persici]
MHSRRLGVITDSDIQNFDSFVVRLVDAIKKHVRENLDIENLYIGISLDHAADTLARAGSLNVSFLLKEPIILKRPLSVSYSNGFWYGTVVLPEQPRSIVIKRSDESSFLNEYLDSLLSEISSALDFIASQLDWSIAPEDRFN